MNKIRWCLYKQSSVINPDKSINSQYLYNYAPINESIYQIQNFSNYYIFPLRDGPTTLTETDIRTILFSFRGDLFNIDCIETRKGRRKFTIIYFLKNTLIKVFTLQIYNDCSYALLSVHCRPPNIVPNFNTFYFQFWHYDVINYKNINIHKNLHDFFKVMCHQNSSSPIWFKIEGPEILSKFEEKKRSRIYHDNLPDDVDLNSLILQNPSWFTIQYYPTTPVNKDVITIKHGGVEYYVETIICIFPFAKKVVDESQYMMLDASFEAVKPYVYCLMNFIKFNHSYPAGFVIHPTENNDLYIRGLTELANRTGMAVDYLINTKPVITDMHKSFISIFANNIHFYYCHFHILRLMGQRNKLVALFLKMLFSISRNEELFKREAPYIKDVIINIANMYEQDKNPFGCWYERLKLMAEGKDDGNFKFSRWALYKRVNDGVAKTTNLSESLHGSINRVVHESYRPNKLNGRVASGINAIIKTVKVHLQNIENKTQYQRQILEKIHKYSETDLNIIQQFSTCPYDCEKYNQKIYGVSFGCPHTGQTIYDKNALSLESFEKRIKDIKWNSTKIANKFKLQALPSTPNPNPNETTDTSQQGSMNKSIFNCLKKYKQHGISEKAVVFIQAIRSVGLTENADTDRFFYKLMGMTNFQGKFKSNQDKQDFFISTFTTGRMIINNQFSDIQYNNTSDFQLHIEESEISEEPVIY